MPRTAKPPVNPTQAAGNNGSTVKDLLNEVDQIRENIKNVLTGLPLWPAN